MHTRARALTSSVGRTGTLGVLALASVLACRPRDDGPREPLDDGGSIDVGSTGAAEVDQAPADPFPNRPAGAIYRSELRRATHDGNAPYLLSQLRPEPYRPQGRFEGWVITSVFPADPELCAHGCDLRAGDIILSVNGSSMQRPEELSEALERLDQVEALEIRGIRDGQYYERSYPILSDPE